MESHVYSKINQIKIKVEFGSSFNTQRIVLFQTYLYIVHVGIEVVE